jgi:hypothetical protein
MSAFRIDNEHLPVEIEKGVESRITRLNPI